MFDVMFRKREVAIAVSTILITIAYELFDLMAGHHHSSNLSKMTDSRQIFLSFGQKKKNQTMTENISSLQYLINI